MASLFDTLLNRVVIETEWLPPIELAQPLSTGGGAATPSTPGTGATGTVKIPPLTRILKPRVSIYTAAGGDPIVIAPYGQPANNWPFLRLILVLGAAIGGVMLVKTTRELRACRKSRNAR